MEEEHEHHLQMELWKLDAQLDNVVRACRGENIAAHMRELPAVAAVIELCATIVELRKQLAEAPWFSVLNEMPPYDLSVLLWIPRKKTFCWGYRSSVHKMWEPRWDDLDVTHWRYVTPPVDE